MTDAVEESVRTPRVFPPNMVQFVRTIEQMQLQLTQMADQKASMLMGASMVVFTITVAQLRAGGQMMIPIALLATGAFLAALFSILTVMPRVTRIRRPYQPGDNLLFFGIFSELSEEEFTTRFLDNMHSDESSFRMMLRDIHQAGSILHHRKYRHLERAYRVFLTGMVLAAISAAIELLLRLN